MPGFAAESSGVLGGLGVLRGSEGVSAGGMTRVRTGVEGGSSLSSLSLLVINGEGDVAVSV